jgi:phosphatidylglycerophosphate synthase
MRLAVEYLPNSLSISRIPLAALLVVTFTTRDAPQFWLSICVIGLALLSDFLDGKIARRIGVASVTGYLLDGLGDKVFYAALLIVIAREEPSQTFISWALIGRELILYGLRVIDPHQDSNKMYLRSVSLFYAFTIRIYFLGFLIWSFAHVYSFAVPGVDYFGVAALPAIIAGYLQILALTKMIVKDFEHRHSHGDNSHCN